jgi:peptidase E
MKFILVGGFPAKNANSGKLFAEEVVEGFDQPIRILECLFARPEHEWQKAFEGDQLFFASQLRDRKINMTLASPAHFLEQLRKTDVVYFRGGVTSTLISVLKECDGWDKELEGKTIVGSSAGVNVLSRYYYSLDNLEVFEGLGILPLKALVHFRSDYNAPLIDWDRAYKELEHVGQDLPILTLSEGEYKVIHT